MNDIKMEIGRTRREERNVEYVGGGEVRRKRTKDKKKE